MRKIVVMLSVSVDGFIEGPGRDLGWHSRVGNGVVPLRYRRSEDPRR